MSQSILQSFLTEHIITIDQNEDYSNLIKSASEVEKRLRNKKSRIVQASQIAFDPNVNSDEPFLKEVQDIVTSKWKAFPSKCQDRPIPYLRSVILTALHSLQNEINLVGIIWLTASNFLPFTTASHREANLLEGFLSEFGNLYEQASWKIWNTSEVHKLPDPEAVKAEPIAKIGSIKSNYAQNNIAAALGKVDETRNEEVFFSFREAYSGTTHEINPSDEWTTSFSKIAGGAIQAIANHIINGANSSLEQAVSIKYVENYTNQIFRYLNQVVDSVIQQTTTQNLRNQLLWIKEAKYSASQRKSYREITLSILPFAVAIDIKNTVPIIYPVSIDYFLKEVIVSVDPKAKEQSTFRSILNELMSSKGILSKIIVSNTPIETGRINLLSFVRELGADKVSINDFEIRTGLKLTDTVSWALIGDWIFRELQVEKILAVKQ